MCLNIVVFKVYFELFLVFISTLLLLFFIPVNYYYCLKILNLLFTMCFNAVHLSIMCYIVFPLY